MKILSYNVNGLAACRENGLLSFISDVAPDIVCLQEIKSQCVLDTPGYHQYWNPAKRKGYAGTLILAKKKAMSVCKALGEEALDNEGRFLALEYRDYYVVNVYSLNTFGKPERRDDRLVWEKALRQYLSNLDKPVIVCGDFNIAHETIDIYPENQRNQQGDSYQSFTTEYRESFDELLACGFVDVFRRRHPKKRDAYTWWSPKNNNRAENRGSRLDYFLVSEDLYDGVKIVKHHTDILYSDHCPISMVIDPSPSCIQLSDERLAELWNQIDWNEAVEFLDTKQRKLAQAARERKWPAVRRIQDEIIYSTEARVLAVRAVTSRRSQAGIDGIRWTTPTDKMRGALSLSPHGYEPLPYRYQEIEEHGRTRVMHIVAQRDKAMNKLYTYALDPVAESLLDKRSFSMRKGRMPQDAHAYLERDLSGEGAPEWIVKADVKAFYENIVHKNLMEIVPMDKAMLRKFLKPGVIKSGTLFETNQGISFASSLSSIFGNLLLNGLQTYIYDELYPYGHQDEYLGGCMTRFADDMIVTARTKLQAEQILYIVNQFLDSRGLRSNPEKTCVVHIAQGFDFVGRHYQKVNGILEVTPADAKVKRCEQELKDLILYFHGTNRKLIERINQKLVGWANHHKTADAYFTFRHIDTVVEGLLLRRMCDLHPRWHQETVKKKYWIKIGGHYVFALPDDPTVRVTRIANVDMVEHKPCALGYHPYLNKHYDRWMKVRRQIQNATGQYRSVWRKQEGKCAYCGLPMLPDQELDVIERHIGDGFNRKNLLYIHRACAYDEIYDDTDEEFCNGVDLFSLLEDLTEEHPAKDSPYIELSRYFFECERPTVTMNFRDIEKKIGASLPWEARRYESFWYETCDTEQARLMWTEEGFPFDDMERTEPNYQISDAWFVQGYRIKRLDLAGERITFYQADQSVSRVVIPKVLLTRKIPARKAYWLNQILKEAVKDL